MEFVSSLYRYSPFSCNDGKIDYFQLLPNEIVDLIILELGPIERFIMGYTSKYMRKFCSKHHLPLETSHKLSYLITIARKGDLALMRWFDKCIGLISDMNISCAAARGGHLHILKFLMDRLGRHTSCWSSLVCASAASSGHLHIIEWLRTVCCRPDERALIMASEKGFIQIVRYLLPDLPKWNAAKAVNFAARKAIMNGHLDILIYLETNTEYEIFDDDLCPLAAEFGHYHIIEWLRKRSVFFPRSTLSCAAAARTNNFEMLRWLRAQTFPWDVKTTAGAVEAGNLAMLQWAVASGCAVDEESMIAAIARRDVDLVKTLFAFKCPATHLSLNKAFQVGSLEIVRLLHTHGCQFISSSASQACSSGNLALVKYLHECGCSLDSQCYNAAVAEGHVPIVEYLYDNNCPMSDFATEVALSCGHFEILEWLYQRRFPITRISFRLTLLELTKKFPFLEKYKAVV